MANIQGFGIQLATGGFSLEANTIFATYAEALAYAQSSAAYVGKVISVTSGEQKGIYSIEAVGADAAFKKVGSDVDLSDYITSDNLENTLNSYATSESVTNSLNEVNDTINTTKSELNAEITTIRNTLTTVYRVKGSVESYDELSNKLTDAKVGDVYNAKSLITMEDPLTNIATDVYPAGTNFVCVEIDGNKLWDALGGTVDVDNLLAWHDA